MRKMLSTAGLACLILGSQVAQAATVRPGGGKVSVNFGGGFVVVRSPSVVHPGSQVMVGKGGYALVVYNKTCIVKVQPGAVYTILEDVPCGAAGGLDDINAFTLGGAALSQRGAIRRLAA